MKTRRGSRLLIIAVASTAALLAACGGSDSGSDGSGDTPTLLVWDQFTDPGTKTAAEKTYAAFEESNDVEIEVESYRYEDIAQLAKTALSSGTGPDVIYYDAGESGGGLLADSELIVPLTEYDEEYGWSERLNKEYLAWSTYSDELYGLGLESEVVTLFSNNSLIQEAGLKVPTTYDELLDFCGAAKDAGYVAVSYGQGPAVLAKDMYALVMNNLVGPDQLAENIFGETGGFDSPESEEALRIWFQEMTDAGCFPEGVNGVTIDNSLASFLSEQALMLAGGTWWAVDVGNELKGRDVSLMPFVEVDGDQGQYYPAGMGSAWFISADAEDPDLAAAFIDSLFSDESVRIWMEDGGLVPPIEVDISDLTLSPVERSAAELIQSGADAAGNELGYQIWPVWSTELFNDFESGAQALTNGDITPEELAADMQQGWEDASEG